MIALTALKMAVLAPMPSVNVSTTTAANAGDLRSVRAAYRTSRQACSTVASQPTLAGLLLHRLDAAKLHAGRSARILGCHASANLRLDGGVQVRLNLFVELLLGAPAAKQPLQSANEALDARHHSCPGVAARILAMAVVCASHWRVSRLSCARPCGVRW